MRDLNSAWREYLKENLKTIGVWDNENDCLKKREPTKYEKKIIELERKWSARGVPFHIPESLKSKNE